MARILSLRGDLRFCSMNASRLGDIFVFLARVTWDIPPSVRYFFRTSPKLRIFLNRRRVMGRKSIKNISPRHRPYCGGFQKTEAGVP